MRIEFGGLRLGATARMHIQEALDSNWISAGPKVKLLEKHWGELFGYHHNKAVSSGTDACLNICLSLYDFGAKRGDEIITPALSFIATANAIRSAGFKPVFVDIETETLNINPKLIEDAITDRTAAIQVVHTMGKPCDMEPILRLGAKHNLPILEDCCEAHGAKYRGGFVGKFGHAAAFSFYLAHLVCCGEGGMVSTQHGDVADVVHSTRSHGRKNGDLYFDFVRTGLNSKMNDLEASIGLEAIDYFWITWHARRRTVSKIREAVAPYHGLAWFSEETEGDENCPHGFSITVKKPEHFRYLSMQLAKNSIHWKRNFGCIPTQHLAFADLGYSLGQFPAAEYVGDNGLHFGVHQHLLEEDVAYICGTLDEIFRKM